jgi:HAMP domain-containing protein
MNHHDAAQRLREAVDMVMRHQWSHTRAAIDDLQVLLDAAGDAADEIERLRKALGEQR